MDPAELERLIDRELGRLPAPRAPRTLLPRVMQAVQARTAAPRPARGWSTWPSLWKLASAAALVVLVVGVIRLWPAAQQTIAGVVDPSTNPVMAPVAKVVEHISQRVEVVVSAGRVVWRVLLQPFAFFALVMVAAMGIACAVFGTALGRVAFGGASQWR
jgi:hypothetical protein